MTQLFPWLPLGYSGMRVCVSDKMPKREFYEIELAPWWQRLAAKISPVVSPWRYRRADIDDSAFLYNGTMFVSPFLYNSIRNEQSIVQMDDIT